MSVRLFLFLVLVAAVGAYIGWPYYTLYRIDAALAQGDGEALDELVDWASVRADIERQLAARGTAASAGGTDDADGAPGGFASLVAPTMNELLIDAYASPRGLAKLVREARIASPRTPPSAAADADAGEEPFRPVVSEVISYARDRVEAAGQRAAAAYRQLQSQYDYLFFTDPVTFEARFAPRSRGRAAPLVLTLGFTNLTWRLTRVDLPSGARNG